MSEEQRISVNSLPKEETCICLDRQPKGEECEQKVLRKVWPWYRVLLLILVAWLVGSLFFIVMVLEVAEQKKKALEANIRDIHVGDTQRRVIAVLGQPKARFAKGGQLFDVIRKEEFLLWLLFPESPETWVYGSWKFLRFGPEEDDYAIQFDDKGCVSRIVFPTKTNR